jgi:hypothetical protein
MGDSPAHRPDLKPVVLARMVSQDGGVPLVRKSGDGHPSDTQGCQQRAEAWRRAFQDAPPPRSLVAEATLSGEDHAVPLAQLGCIPRMPGTLQVVAPGMGQALQEETWQPGDANPRYPPLALGH